MGSGFVPILFMTLTSVQIVYNIIAINELDSFYQSWPMYLYWVLALIPGYPMAVNAMRIEQDSPSTTKDTCDTIFAWIFALLLVVWPIVSLCIGIWSTSTANSSRYMYYYWYVLVFGPLSVFSIYYLTLRAQKKKTTKIEENDVAFHNLAIQSQIDL